MFKVFIKSVKSYNKDSLIVTNWILEGDTMCYPGFTDI